MTAEAAFLLLAEVSRRREAPLVPARQPGPARERRLPYGSVARLLPFLDPSFFRTFRPVTPRGRVFDACRNGRKRARQEAPHAGGCGRKRRVSAPGAGSFPIRAQDACFLPVLAGRALFSADSGEDGKTESAGSVPGALQRGKRHRRGEKTPAGASSLGKGKEDVPALRFLFLPQGAFLLRHRFFFRPGEGGAWFRTCFLPEKSPRAAPATLCGGKHWTNVEKRSRVLRLESQRCGKSGD